METHLVHLRTILDTLRSHPLFAKLSKCSFGHVVTSEGVKADPTKVECMLKWPEPIDIKSLRGFLGLTGYYRRFVKNYEAIAKPLNDLLKKNGFELHLPLKTRYPLVKNELFTISHPHLQGLMLLD